MPDFRATVLDTLIALLWRQWASIGVSGFSQAQETQVVDPEALLVLTATVGRHDARLFDAVLDWLQINSRYLNAQRLRNLTRRADPSAQAVISSMAHTLSGRSEAALKWRVLASSFSLPNTSSLFYQDSQTPMPVIGEPDKTYLGHGLLRRPYSSRGSAGVFPGEGIPALLLRLRALLGVNIRCEILCLLGARTEAHPSLLARLIGQSPRTLQSVLADMVRSGVVQLRPGTREKNYALVPGPLDPLLRPGGPTPWMNSVPLFAAFEKIWLGISDPRCDELDTLTLASQWRRLAMEVSPHFGLAGWGQPLSHTAKLQGEQYCQVFVDDVLGLLARA